MLYHEHFRDVRINRPGSPTQTETAGNHATHLYVMYPILRSIA
jgi:hypothetical protein